MCFCRRSVLFLSRHFRKWKQSRHLTFHRCAHRRKQEVFSYSLHLATIDRDRECQGALFTVIGAVLLDATRQHRIANGRSTINSKTI